MPETKQDTAAKKRIRVGHSSFRKAQNPEPVEKETTGDGPGKGIVKWGDDNLYPHDLVAYRQDNPIHGGIIAQKITYISSAGLLITGLDEKVREAVEDVCEDITDCFETFNGFAVLFTNVGGTWTPSHIDFESVRYKTKGNMFAISDDWSARKQSAEITNYREVKDLRYVQLSGDDADTEVLLYCKVKPKQRKLKNGKLSLGYYPVPMYIGAVVSILAGIEQDYFTYSESVNGYKGGTIISLNNGEPDTDEEADEIADKIKAEATDRDTQGGITVVFADGTENAATVSTLNGNDLDKRYIEANKEIRNKILIGHAAGSPTLFAVNSESMFGNKEEMEIAYTLFSNNYVNKRQNFMSGSLEWAFSRLGVQNVSIQFKKYVLDFGPSTAQPVTQSKFERQDPILKILATLGVQRKSTKVVTSRSFDFKATDEEFLASQIPGFNDLSEAQKTIVGLIRQNKSFSQVSKALGKGALYLSRQVMQLNLKGVLNGWKFTDASKFALEVRYSYEVKAGLGAPVIETTRDFCRELIDLDRLYTREEIERLSIAVGRDIWRYRGGWYTNPDTGVTTPSCRHEWVQNVVSL